MGREVRCRKGWVVVFQDIGNVLVFDLGGIFIRVCILVIYQVVFFMFYVFGCMFVKFYNKERFKLFLFNNIDFEYIR